MTGVALALVLVSAVAHATWNLLAKRAGAGVALTWVFDGVSVLLVAPFAALAYALVRPPLGLTELILMAGSAVLHAGYFLALMGGYRAGDMSVVYPLARGLGPLLAVMAAVVVLGERPTPLAIGGTLLIGVGILALTGGPRLLAMEAQGRSIAYALLTGLLVAAYTMWDKHAVGRTGAMIPPLVYFWGFTAGRVLLLTPLGLTRLDEVRAVWREHRAAVLGIALLSPLSYLLVLVALETTPVSYVAPAREIGILFGVLLGTRLLAEGHATRRVGAALAMIVGVVLLALG